MAALIPLSQQVTGPARPAGGRTLVAGLGGGGGGHLAPVVERRSGKGERALPGAGPLLLLLLLLPQAGASGAGSALGHRPCLSPRSGGGSARGGERVGARRETGPGWGRGGPAAPGLVSPAVGPGLSFPGAEPPLGGLRPFLWGHKRRWLPPLTETPRAVPRGKGNTEAF